MAPRTRRQNRGQGESTFGDLPITVVPLIVQFSFTWAYPSWDYLMIKELIKLPNFIIQNGAMLNVELGWACWALLLKFASTRPAHTSNPCKVRIFRKQESHSICCNSEEQSCNNCAFLGFRIRWSAKPCTSTQTWVLKRPPTHRVPTGWGDWILQFNHHS